MSFDRKIEIWAEPNFRSENLFSLHEGTKVQVLDSLQEWKKIKIANGAEGWTKEAIIKKASEDPPEQENQMKLDEIAEELKIICSKNDLPDLSENTESLLTYTLFI